MGCWLLKTWVPLFLVSVQGLFFTIQLRFRGFRGFVLQSAWPEAIERLQ